MSMGAMSPGAKSDAWSPGSEVVAWTEHDGPGRPPAGPNPRWYQGLAIGWGAWFSLAVVGCEVVHHNGTEHIPLSLAETIGGTAVFLGLPALLVLLLRRHPVGAWMAALLGVLACSISASQWSIVPWYTAIEAGGFAVLTVAAVVLGVLQLRSRFGAMTAQVPARPAPVAAPTDVASTSSSAGEPGSNDRGPLASW
jgi:hypothetical protein